MYIQYFTKSDVVSESSAKTKYRFLVREWHPDVNKAPNATAIFQQIQAEYDFIKSKQIWTIYNNDIYFQKPKPQPSYRSGGQTSYSSAYDNLRKAQEKAKKAREEEERKKKEERKKYQENNTRYTSESDPFNDPDFKSEGYTQYTTEDWGSNISNDEYIRLLIEEINFNLKHSGEVPKVYKDHRGRYVIFKIYTELLIKGINITKDVINMIVDEIAINSTPQQKQQLYNSFLNT